MPRNLSSDVVLVTGITSGIGREAAVRLARAGATVVGCARDSERLEEVRAEAPGLDVVTVDVRDAVARAKLVSDVVSRYGRIDALVNNAGVGRVGWFADTTADDIEDVFTTNAIGYSDLTRLVLPHMSSAGRGHIVMVSSSAGWFSFPPLTLYAASKFAVEGLAQGLRSELQGTGILVHTVNPGPVSTEFPARAAGHHPEENDAWADDKPVSFATDPAKVVDAIVACLGSTSPRTIPVPRSAGLAKLAQIPVVGSLLHTVVGRTAPTLVRKGKGLVRDRVPPARR